MGNTSTGSDDAAKSAPTPGSLCLGDFLHVAMAVGCFLCLIGIMWAMADFAKTNAALTIEHIRAIEEIHGNDH